MHLVYGWLYLLFCSCHCRRQGPQGCERTTLLHVGRTTLVTCVLMHVGRTTLLTLEGTARYFNKVLLIRLARIPLPTDVYKTMYITSCK